VRRFDGERRYYSEKEGGCGLGVRRQHVRQEGMVWTGEESGMGLGGVEREEEDDNEDGWWVGKGALA